MAATNYMLLLLLVLIAVPLDVAAMGGQHRGDQDSDPDPRRPRPPPPAPPRPRPPPPPPPPSPPPPAGPHVPTPTTPAAPLAGVHVSDVEREHVLDVDPDTQELGIPATGGRTLASSSSTPAVSVGVTDTNPGGNLQHQRTDNPHVSDDTTKKCVELKAKLKQSKEAKSMNSAPSIKGSAVNKNVLDYDDVIGLMVKFCEKNTSDDSKPKFTTKREYPTKSKTADESCDQGVPGNVSSDNGAIKDADTDQFCHLINSGSRIYMGANWKLYRSMEDLEVVAVIRENGEIIEKPQNTRSIETSPSATTVKSYHCANPSSTHDGMNLRAVRRLPPVECFATQRAKHIHMESVAARRNCTSTEAKRQYTRNLNSSASKYPGDSVGQRGALQRAASVPKGTEPKLPSRRLQQQTETSHTTVAAKPGEQVASSRLPSQTLGGSTSTSPPLNDAQSEATRRSILKKKRYRRFKSKKRDTATQTGVQPENWRNRGNLTTATSAEATKSPHSGNPPPHAAGNATRTKRSRVDVKGAANQGADSISMKDSDAMSVPIEQTLKFGSFTFEDPIYSIIHSRATQSAVTMPKTGEQKLRGHLPQKKKKPASETGGASNSASSSVCRACGKMNRHSRTASANMQQRKRDLFTGHQNRQLQQTHVLPPVVVVPVPESMLLSRSPYLVSSYPSALNSGVGYLANQQSAQGGSTLQNPVPGNPTAATLPGHQSVSACIGTPGNSRNQQDAAVQVNIEPLSTHRRTRPPEVHIPHIPRFEALRQRRGGYRFGQEAGSARYASCQPHRTDTRSHM